VLKWPVRLELVNAPFHGYYHNERYIIVDCNDRTLGSVREMPVKSVIAWPVDGEVVASAVTPSSASPGQARVRSRK